MAYPKPLTSKTIEKRYKEAGLKEEQIAFLRRFFLACANLYGRIPLEEAWAVYKDYAARPAVTDCVKLKRKDLLNAADIMRREADSPFYVYEVEDLYCDIRNSDLIREILNKELISVGYGKLHSFFRLMENIRFYGYYIPDNLLEYADPAFGVTEQEKALYAYLGNLVVNMDEYEEPYCHTMVACSGHKGEKLGNLYWMNRDERGIIEYSNGEWGNRKANAKEVAYWTAKYDKPVARKLVDRIKECLLLDMYPFTEMMEVVIEDLNKVGVGLNEAQHLELVNLIADMINNQNVWCMQGWRPDAICDRFRQEMKDVPFD